MSDVIYEFLHAEFGFKVLDCETLPGFLGYGSTSARDCSLFARSVFPIPNEARQSCQDRPKPLYVPATPPDDGVVLCNFTVVRVCQEGLYESRSR